MIALHSINEISEIAVQMGVSAEGKTFPLEKEEITRKMDVQQCGYFKYRFPHALL